VDANSQANTNAPTDGAPWDHLGQVNGSGGSYLGGGWVLTAGHVGPGNVVFDGTTFIWDGALRWLTNSDGSFTDSIMLHLKTSPSLPRLALSSKTPGAFSVVDLIGYGYRSGSAETSFGVGIVGYYWSANPGKSWGNNKVKATGLTVNGGFGNLSFRKFRNDRLQSSCGLGSGFAHGCGSRRHGNWRTKAGKSFFRFLFPLRPAKTLGGGRIPTGRFYVRTDLLMELREFKRNHSVACAFIQRRELSGGIRAGSRLTDTRLNLSPIAH